VLISGETGTGKEMAARAIHAASPRAHATMISVNCTALPENLLEAELFGHTKGAFTGAINHRVGRFEQAHKSTLFLDEIGDMPLDLQAKLLRVLQDKEFQRLGSSETTKVDVRIIAASNVDLVERIREGTFREDLYYRLNVVPLAIPSLRTRKEDIPALVRHFVAKICLAENIELKHVAPGALDSLCAQLWPGNIRQLENSIEMAVALSGDRQTLTSRDFGLHPVPARRAVSETPARESISIACGANFETAISQFEFALLDGALRESAGNKTVAAERLGIKRTTLIMKLKNLEKARLRGADAGILSPRGNAPVDLEQYAAA
jgi:transcriptional regulator with PAS, ATPase and Fis domain